jgi:hypothetical protein
MFSARKYIAINEQITNCTTINTHAYAALQRREWKKDIEMMRQSLIAP